jgi:tetratricopeptide (TPR) repeat protein
MRLRRKRFHRAAAPLITTVALVFAATGCNRSLGLLGQSQAHQRVAVLPIDNLTGDPALDWVAGAAPRVVAEELTGAASTVPLLAASVNDAYAEGATRLLHGYVELRAPDGSAAAENALHFEFRLEDTASHKMQPVTFDGAPLEVLGQLAHRIDPTAHAFSSANPQAVEAFGRGDFARAVELDPDFSTAWLGWAQSLSTADAAQAIEVANRALARSGLRSATDRSRIELLAATLRHDPQAELKAMESLARQSPQDPNSVRTLAEAAMNARQFADAARYYQDLHRLAPDDANALNLAGYAYAFAGDLNSAMKAFDQYRRQPGQEPNALDSIGEAQFVNGKFSEAEKYFLQAHDKNASLLGGGDLLKAAYAHWLGGDLAGADQLSARYLQFRTQAQDKLVPWRAATWLFSTGRADRARAGLESTLPSADPQLAALARKQLEVWNSPFQLSKDLAVLKRAYDSTPPAADGLARTFYATALFETGDKDHARSLVAQWPLPESAGDPVLQAFLFPKFLALREKLK